MPLKRWKFGKDQRLYLNLLLFSVWPDVLVSIATGALCVRADEKPGWAKYHIALCSAGKQKHRQGCTGRNPQGCLNPVGRNSAGKSDGLSPLESVSKQNLVWLNCAAGGMVRFKVCSGTLAVTVSLVPLFIIINYLFISPILCRQGGVRGIVTRGLRHGGASLWGERGWCRVWSVHHGSPGLAYSHASMCTLKSTFRTCFLV